MKKWSLGIHARYLVPMTKLGTWYEHAFIGISDSKITSVLPQVDESQKIQLQKDCAQWIDLGHHIVLPGLINTHTHLAMTLFRSVEDNMNLQEWLFQRIFPLEATWVTPEFVELGTRLAALECIRFGTTTVADMYFYPERALKVWKEFGLRGFFPQPLISGPSPGDPKGDFKNLLEKTQILWEEYQNHPYLKTGLAPHAPYTCSPELLEQVRDFQEKNNCLISIHVAETFQEVQDIKERYQKTPFQYLNDLGLMNPQCILAHAVHPEKEDWEILKTKKPHLSHCPDSNLKLGSGIAPVTEYWEHQIPVSLGTDGAASSNDLSLFGTMDLATKLQKVRIGDLSRFTTWMALWMATRGGAKALGWEDQIGQIKEGFEADLIALDCSYPHMMPISDPSGQLVFCANGLEVSHTLVAGQWKWKNYQWQVADPEGTLKEAQRLREKMLKTKHER